MPVPYFPATYGYNPSFAQPLAQNQYGAQPQQSQNGLIVAWVQGEQAMKSFALGPNQKAFLFNTEENNFGIKTTDANGMPNPLDMFSYQRIDSNKQTLPAVTQPSPAIDTSAFVTREELDNRFLEFMIELEGKGDSNHGK